jgi:predicted DNA-binding transcriptional regulator YafY
MEKTKKSVETIRLSMEILRRIPRKAYISAPELQVQLENANIKRDLRSIQRQLKTLCDAFDIECDMSDKPYSYRWKEAAEGFSLQMLNDQDALLLTLAEQHLKNLLPANLMKSMEKFFEQARKRFDPVADLKSFSNTSRSREWLSKVRVVSETQALIPPSIKAGVLEQISNALYSNRWLEVHYKNAAGKSNRYDVMPLGLAQQGPRLYLVCRFQGHTNERSLALHRISAVTASPLTFERPKDFDLKKYDADGRFGFGEGKKIQLSFMIDKKVGQHLLESPLSKDQTVDELDDCFRISATVVDTGHLRWWLRGFGDGVWDLNGVKL